LIVDTEATEIKIILQIIPYMKGGTTVITIFHQFPPFFKNVFFMQTINDCAEATDKSIPSVFKL